jgi:hypothetical protein
MKSREARRRIPERAMSLRFLGIILRVLRLEVSVCNVLNYLCTYDLYGPVRDAFDADSIHYEGKWEGVWPWKARILLGPIEPIGEGHLGPKNSRYFCPNYVQEFGLCFLKTHSSSRILSLYVDAITFSA